MRRALVATLLVLAVLGGGAGWRFGPALGLALGLATGTGPAGPDAGVVRVTVAIPAGARTIAADLYRPPAPRGALLLVHGLSRLGRRQPDLERLARLLADRGQVVLVPQFEGLAAFRLTGAEVADVRAALRYLQARAPGTGVAGFSFGAGPALLAAADVPGLRVVGAFGGYADLRHVIGFITTGVHSFGAAHYQDRPEAYNRWKLLALLAGFVRSPRDRALLEQIAARRLADPQDDTGDLEGDLGPAGRRVWALVVNRRPDALPALLAGLPPAARAALDALSPLPVLGRLSGRLLVAHGAGDQSIPFTESLRLAAAAGVEPVIFRTFEHTGPRRLWHAPSDMLHDAWHLVRLADALLASR
ncbi:MAG TPA: hypothetical protein VNK50_00345 [Calidithermus sp.]|nr:hypothetical protein [Calidithermus sp.]